MRKGKLENLAAKKLLLMGLVLASVLLQFLINIDYSRFGYLTHVAPYLHLLSYAFLFAFIYANRKMPGMVFMGLGIFLNFLVIAANGGTMPVSPAILGLSPSEIPTSTGDALHSVATADTRLFFLADIIPLPIPKGTLVSIGDIILGLGLFYFIQQAMQPREKNSKIASP